MAFRGDFSGITSKNKPNATYQSIIDGELLYEYAIHRYTNNKTRATFRCAGCRSAIDDGITIKNCFFFSQCLTKLNQKVKECEENGDHNDVMSRIGTTETVRRRLKAAAKPTFVQNCMPADIDEELQKSSSSNGSNIVRINDEDFVFIMEDKGIEIC
uniref:Uncharacterized protein n=1 Tax=Panagrolaimus davidi TaxID=227884 RepID=A0A914QQY8_9BILA